MAIFAGFGNSACKWEEVEMMNEEFQDKGSLRKETRDIGVEECDES